MHEFKAGCLAGVFLFHLRFFLAFVGSAQSFNAISAN